MECQCLFLWWACEELLLCRRIFLPGKGKVFVAEFNAVEFNDVVSFADRDSRWVLFYFYLLVLQNRFADIEQLSDPQNGDLFGISESIGRLRHLTEWPWQIDHIPMPSTVPDFCRELFLRRFPYPRNVIVVVVCPLNSVVRLIFENYTLEG